ncbi:hypothetical protein BS78_05G204200 [Paspalum vaginatum]|nr:hypothetical protein BS78_05G204200 [Paspalum vaginatum]
MRLNVSLAFILPRWAPAPYILFFCGFFDVNQCQFVLAHTVVKTYIQGGGAEDQVGRRAAESRSTQPDDHMTGRRKPKRRRAAAIHDLQLSRVLERWVRHMQKHRPCAKEESAGELEP